MSAGMAKSQEAQQVEIYKIVKKGSHGVQTVNVAKA